MRLVLEGLIVWICGLFYEASCVGFVHFSERANPVLTAVMSMAGAAAQVTGIFGSVNEVKIAPFFVVGIGTGAFVGVVLKRRARTEAGDLDVELERLAADVERILERRRSLVIQ